MAKSTITATVMATELTNLSQPTRVPGVVERWVEGQLVLYQVDLQRVHILNPTAAFLWGLCDGTRGQTDLVDALASRYPEAGPAIAADVASFLRTLRAELLLADQ